MLFRAATGIHVISLRGNLFRSRAKQVGRILLVAIEHISIIKIERWILISRRGCCASARLIFERFIITLLNSY